MSGSGSDLGPKACRTSEVPEYMDDLLADRDDFPERLQCGEGRLLVLVADADEQLRRALRSLLASHGIEVIEAVSGTEALALAVHSDPDIVVMAWTVPAGGLPLARTMINEHGMERRVIMLVEHHDRRDHRAAMDLGVADYCVKPLNHDRLIRVIESLGQRNR
jgi:DNA-binding response OmpR family regulator